MGLIPYASVLIIGLVDAMQLGTNAKLDETWVGGGAFNGLTVSAHVPRHC